MKIKVTLNCKEDRLNGKSTIMSPQGLLDSDSDSLLEFLVCDKCNSWQQQGEGGEPGCYGECFDRVIQEQWSFSYELIKER